MTVSFDKTTPYAPTATAGATGLNLTSRETPQRTTTVSEERIKEQNLKTLKDVLENTTGINVHAMDGTRYGFISRGFEIGKVSIDGASVNFNQGDEYHLATALYDKVEITHGANSLVSGSGEPAAGVNLVRKKANSAQRVTEISVNANRFGNYGISFDHNQALNKSGTVRGRVVGLYQDGKTFTDREERGYTALYATVQADLTPSTTLDVGATYRKNKQENIMWGGLPMWFSNGTKADWDTDKNSGANWTKWNRETTEYFANLEHRFNDDWKVNIKASHTDNEATPKLLYQNTGVVDVATGLVNGGVYPYREINNTDSTHLQADLAGAFGAFGRKHQVMLGVSQNKQKVKVYAYPLTVNGSPTSFLTWDGSYPEPTWGTKNTDPESDYKVDEKSAYGAVQLKPTDKLSVVLGSRVTNFDREGFSYGTPNATSYNSVWTPYAGVIYAVNDNLSLYTSYTNSFKPQTSRDVNGNYLDPEEGNSYEIGVKGGSDTIQGQLTAFYIQKENYAQESGNTVINTTNETAYIGVDGAKSVGIEAEVMGKVSPNLQMTLGYTQYKIEDQDGNKLDPKYSKRQIKLFGTYDMSRFVNGLSVGAGVNWKDKYYSLETNPATSTQEKFTQKSVALVDVMARYAVNKNLDLQLNISNVLNQKYKHGVGFGQFIYGEPLNATASVTYRF